VADICREELLVEIEGIAIAFPLAEGSFQTACKIAVGTLGMGT
jgi:hypothetical protein